MTDFFKRRGSRLDSNMVKVRRTRNGQFSLTIPKALALAYQLSHGSVVHWEFAQDGLKLKRVRVK